jgi:FKBP-type peptidyl-prolyl cis-trans isomerase
MRCSDFIILEKKREEVLKDADKKFPNLKKAEMKKMLKDQEKGAKDFKQKSKKYFGWAKDPEAAAAAFIRKATGKEPKDL